MAAAVHSRTTSQCVMSQDTRSILALALHPELGLEIRAISRDARDSQRLVASQVFHHAIIPAGISFDDGAIPTLGVSHVVDLDVVVHAPEEWDGFEALAGAKNIAG